MEILALDTRCLQMLHLKPGACVALTPAPTPTPAPVATATQSCSDSLSDGSLQMSSLISSETTSSQYILNGNQSQVTYRFISSVGTSEINELRFSITGNDVSSVNTVSRVCINSICANNGAGVADLKFAPISVPTGNGVNICDVSYFQSGHTYRETATR